MVAKAARVSWRICGAALPLLLKCAQMPSKARCLPKLRMLSPETEDALAVAAPCFESGDLHLLPALERRPPDVP